MSGWLLIIGAAALATIELVLPGWVFVSLSISLAVMGALMLAGFALSLPLMLIYLGLLTGAVWIILSRLFPSQRGSVKVWDTDING